MTKEEKTKIAKSDLNKTPYYWIYLFLSLGFLGWIYETIVMSVHYHHFAVRGDILVDKTPAFEIVGGLPLITLYGVGGLIIMLIFQKTRNPLKLFFLGSLIATTLELITSYICTIFGKELWHYRPEFITFEGRISVVASIVWGLLTVALILFLQPLLIKFYNILSKRKHMHAVLVALLIYAIICLIMRNYLMSIGAMSS
jgi:Predicted membrane protein